MLKTIQENISDQIVEKKSKFIANIFYISSEEEAYKIINDVKKKYYDARHNCYAFRVMKEEGTVEKMSDDGEPGGTAGAPILNILNKNEMINILVIVTRYFGGILLGTGGLVKAYSEVTLKTIKNAKLVIEEKGVELEVILEYKEYEKLNYYCMKNNIKVLKVSYNDKVTCIIELNEREKDKIVQNINELSFKIIKYKIIKEKNIRKNIEK